MTVYVDNVEHAFGNMKMCHMWADTLDELLAMVDRIEVRRMWIQGHPTLSFGKHRNASWVHFDIAKSKRALAIKAGAILTDHYGPAYHTSPAMRPRIEAARIARGADPKTGMPA
jgi:hypothetical protein